MEHEVRMEVMRNAYRVLVKKPAGKRPDRGCRRRGKDNIEIHLKEIGFKGMN